MGIKRTTFNKTEKSWILYDVGNSALFLLSSSIIPIYFNSLAAADPAVEDVAVGAWGAAETVASLVIALLMPILGSLADMEGMRKKFIMGCVLTGSIATVCMGFPNGWLAFLVAYVVSSIALNSSTVFYDALLVDATSEDRRDEVSSQGFAWGYVGSCIPFIACLLIVLNAGSLGISTKAAMNMSFFITAAWWVVFTIPLIKNVKQTSFKPKQPRALRSAVLGIGSTLRDIWNHKSIRYFILSYFFYIDGVHTIIRMSTSYGSNLGIEGTQLILALLVTQFVAWPSSIAYGKLGTKVGTKKMLLVGIAAYFCITLFASFFLRTATQFWILAICVGMFQGGIQALSRSEFSKLCPKEHANEYFGFFDIFGKYAAILGTGLVSVFTFATHNPSLGVLSIAIMFVIGFVIMLKVPDRL
ncbi:MAG: MFS transporter [Coriobacteriales bacterium]|nr:MFS transporter [Coriobacteriales bacterium]